MWPFSKKKKPVVEEKTPAPIPGAPIDLYTFLGVKTSRNDKVPFVEGGLLPKMVDEIKQLQYQVRKLQREVDAKLR